MGILGKDEYGLVYRLGDTEDLAEKLTRYIEDRDLLYEKSLAGQRQAMQTFSSERMAKDIYEVYGINIVCRRDLYRIVKKAAPKGGKGA